MDSFVLVALTASACAAIATTCLSLSVLNILEMIHVDRDIKEDAKALPIFFRLFMPFASNMKFLVSSPAFASMKNRAEEQLQMAGYDQAITASEFVSIRLLSAMTGVVLMLLFFVMNNPLPGVLLAFLLLIYPATWLRSAVKKRHLEILKALPNILDLLTLSVEAGKDFLTSLRDILTGRKPDALGEELSRALQEIQLGKQRQDALKELVNRVRQPDLTSVINAIIQAEELGVSIGQLLRIQGDQLRSKRFSRAEKLANEAPVKILFPVIVFIFPAVIIILMAPIIMQAFKTFAK